MAASQVVLYFDKQEDAMLFTLAASSMIAADNPPDQSAMKIAKEIRKVTRITTEGSINRQAECVTEAGSEPEPMHRA